ncbi:MAG: hypothetical protein OEY80_08115 [Nitrospirota bacterium]|nr:hypothetical protein [Nitrospirota bacterium]
MGILSLSSAACDKVSIPRLGFEEKPEPRLPMSVTYAFSPKLVNSTHTVDACGLPYTIQVGEIITKTFIRVGQDRFNGVRAEPPVGDAQGATLDGYRITVDLQQFGFDPEGRSGEEDRYQALVDLNLLAVYEESGGTPLAQTPLSYHKNVRLWTPELSSQSSSCSTTQIDGAVKEAAETLAKEMASLMPRLGQQSAAVPMGNISPGASAQAPTPAPQVVSPSVQFRTKLVDANKNLILESGEALALLIETKNISDSNIPSAYVELRGTPILVEAFKRVAPIPVPLGSLKAGETRTTEIRGRLDQVTETIQGELIIGIILSEGLPPGTHSIRAEIKSGPTRKKPTR